MGSLTIELGMRRTVWAILCLTLAAGCDRATDAPVSTLAGPGEACAETTDCAAGLDCIALQCLVAVPVDAAAGVDATDATAPDAPSPDATLDIADPFDAGPPTPSSNPDELDDQTLAISGRVLYSGDLSPIEGALVTGTPGLGAVLSNKSGQYVFLSSDHAPIEPGALYQITASRAAYEDNSVVATATDGHARDVDILLDAYVPNIPFGANPSALDFDLGAFGGSDTAVKQVVLFLTPTFEGGGPVGFTIAVQPPASWLSVKPATGQVGKTPFTLVVTVDRTGLTGSAQGSFAVTPSTGDPLSIPVTVTATQ